MDGAEWDEALEQLTAAADVIAVLQRCLSVEPHLVRWRESSEALAGQLAADALDQAQGVLLRLKTGGAAELLALVDRLISVLPEPLE